MTWQGWRLTYELRSPLHIGYHKLGNVQRTRPYVPARNLWGAVTERLTRGGFSAAHAPEGDYRAIGAWVTAHCAFSYFFLCEGDTLLNPQYKDGKFCYGNLRQAAFERRYLDAHVTTALDATTTSAEDASLHEVEFIAPHWLDDADSVKRTQVRGGLFLDETAQARQTEIQERLRDLHIGGERRYGFGQLRQVCWQETPILEECPVILDGERPGIEVAQDKALLAHTLTPGVDARGQIEPLVGRETLRSHTFGHNLTAARVCWTPGAVLASAAVLEIAPDGCWRSPGR